MTCYRCGAEIDPNERAGKILVDKWLCEICLEKAEKCAPREVECDDRTSDPAGSV